MKKAEITAAITSEESVNALGAAVNMIKKEYGEMQLTAAMRKQLAEDLGEDPETVDKWQSVVDVLNHIDIAELAQKHPDAIGAVAKTIISVLSLIFPAVKLADAIPQDFAAKIVGFAGILTPEHLVNMIAKSQVKKNKEKREKLAQQPSPALPEGAEDSTVAEEKKNAQPAAVGKKAIAGITGLFTKKKAPADKKANDEDIFETIKRLSELKDSGIITAEEFETKKTELLERI